MYESEWFTYASAPKTGNQWFTIALRGAGVTLVDTGQHKTGQVDGKPNVTIVREPFEWLRSDFVQVFGCMEIPVDDIIQSMREGQDQTFDNFASRYVNEIPGAITRMFRHYEADFALHTETLADDTIDMLIDLGVKCDLDYVRNAPPVDVTKDKPAISDALRNAIREAEGSISPAQTLSYGFTS